MPALPTLPDFGPLTARGAGALLATVVLAAALSCSAPVEGPEESRAEAGGGTPASSPGEGPRQLTVLGSGDLLIHPPVWEQARSDGGGEFDFFPMLEGVASVVSGADLALCHLEVPLGEPEGPFSGYPVFEAPPQLLEGVARAGYDGCSTASNHTLDQGPAGVARTLDALEEHGLGAAGSARTAEEAAEPRVYQVEVGGEAVAVAHLAYTQDFNGMSPPAGQEWMANLIDVEAVLAEARTAREAGAEIVVLSMHWGSEYSHDVDSRQEEWAGELAGSEDIDLILGHHAHVVQPVELVEGTWVVYGMGNHLARHAQPDDFKREGVMARATFIEDGAGGWEVESLEMVPTWIDIDPRVRVVDLSAALADSEAGDSHTAAHERVTGYLDARGALADGMVIAPVG